MGGRVAFEEGGGEDILMVSCVCVRVARDGFNSEGDAIVVFVAVGIHVDL